MGNKVKFILGVLVLVLVISVASLAYDNLSDRFSIQNNLLSNNEISNTESADSNSEVEKSEMIIAPDFTVEDSDGNAVKLSEMFGKPIVVNFWASWCPPCKAEMPEFNKVYEEIGDDITFMMIDLVDGQRETKEKGAAYIAEQGFTFPVYYDTSGEAGYTYGISSIPTTIFIDKNGYVITGVQGAISEEILMKGIGLIE